MKKDFTECPVTFALGILNGKWKFSIVYYLSKTEYLRFNELQRELKGISNLMLSRSLQVLEQSKIVNRIQYNEIPPRVEYSLTELGRDLSAVIDSLDEWGMKAMKKINEEI
jgi:DNA-binding HxlR family transcriptional regulator